ncbi:hypothetical protein LOC67_07390 [Stieleria sp. JC731]|uniref:hypothetical protein n=1 Tax=Pirellulaceae TaxID=2691357 RepID=UPI001E4EE445|nr:hypothetical protein [Stieleria sp. JC731]MCC9600380.1 hypothetical protein [Stieleria sp. JC731]
MLSQSKGESDLRLAGKNSAKFDHPLLPNFDESPHEIEEARTEDTQCPDDIQSCEQKFRAILEATDDKDWKPGGEAVRKKMSKVWTGRQKGWIFGTNDNRVGFVNTQRTPIVSRWNVDHWDQLIETSRIEALTNFFSAYPTGNFRMSPSRNEE